MTDFKTIFLEHLFENHAAGAIRVLDLGSGTSKDFPGLLRRYPNVAYTGVEPSQQARAKAGDLLAGLPNVTLEQGWGEALARKYQNHFDVTLSLSVIEHVKFLPKFLRTSVDVTAPGGLVIHRYDLGHALYPASMYERLLVVASRSVPWAVPARIFTTKPDVGRIVAILQSRGLRDVSVGHGQMYGLKQAMNQVSRIDETLARRMVQLDSELADTLRDRLPSDGMDRLFPTITISGTKRS